MSTIIKLSAPDLGRYLVELIEGGTHKVTLVPGRGVYRRVRGDAPLGAFVIAGSVLNIVRHEGELRAVMSRSEQVARVDGHATLLPAWSVRKPSAIATA